VGEEDFGETIYGGELLGYRIGLSQFWGGWLLPSAIDVLTWTPSSQVLGSQHDSESKKDQAEHQFDSHKGGMGKQVPSPKLASGKVYM